MKNLDYETEAMFFDIAVNSTRLYNAVNKELKKKGLNLKYWLSDNFDLANEVLAYHFNLLQKYNPERGSLLNWLVSTLPNKLIRKYYSVSVEDEDRIEAEEEDIYIIENNNRRIIKPAFDRMYFLTDYQKKIADFYYNQELPPYVISRLYRDKDIVYIAENRINRDIKHINKKINKYFEDDFHFYIYCILNIFNYNTVEFLDNNNEISAAVMVYGNGCNITTTAAIMGCSRDTVYKYLELATKKMKEEWKEEIEKVKPIKVLLSGL